MTIAAPTLDAGALIASGFTAVVADLPIYPRSFGRAVDMLRQWNEAFASNPLLRPVLSETDLYLAKRDACLGIVLACQDAAVLGVPVFSVSDRNLTRLRHLHMLGLRVLQLTHNDRNGIADSFWERTDAGLSRLGEAVVDEMNRLGMLIDLSHCSRLTLLQAARRSHRPCIVSHTGCRRLFDTARNKSDEEIRAVANTGGVVGVFNMTMWLTDNSTATADALMDHIDYIVNLVGVEHAAFGGDQREGAVDDGSIQLGQMQSYVKNHLGLPGSERVPTHITAVEFLGPGRLMHLAERMTRRGYQSPAIKKILGGNFARVFGEACG